MLKRILTDRATRRLLALSLLLFPLSLPALAQEGTSTLRGTVTDPTGAVIPNATVSVANQATGLNRRMVVTDASGDYAFASLVPGAYRVTVDAAGFKKTTHDNLRLSVGETRELKLELAVGGASDTVNISSEAALIATASKEIGGHIDQRALTELPSINRNFIGFVGLLPGVVPNISTESFGSDSVSINGQDPRYNNFLLDGANNNDDVIGQRAGGQTRTALESVQEFQVLTNQFDAQYGRTSGGVINAITKSGTNLWHGSGIGFFQDAALNADNRFAVLNNLPKTATSNKQFGGTLGGPIKQDRAHFFVGLERTLIDEGIVINIPARPEFNTSTVERTRALNTTARFDTQPSDKHQIAVRWLYEHSPQFNQIIGAVTLDAAREEDDTDQTYVGSWTYTVSPRLLNDLRINFTQEDVAFANPGFNSGKSMAELPPTLVFASFTAGQSNVAQSRVNNSYRLADTVNWIRSNHSFKFGFEYNYVTARNLDEGTFNGQFTFPTNAPFNAADPRTYPERFSIRVPGPLKFTMINHNTSVFAQDDWKVNQRLTLNLGLRYEDESISRDNNNLSPRAGFAWDVRGTGRSVVRGGYGFFFQNTPFELITAFRTAGPFSDSFVRNFPLNAADPGPRAGRLPTDPTLVKGPVVDRALVQQLLGSGTTLPNPNPVIDNKDRLMPYTRSASLGFQQELMRNLALTVDYIHQDNVDQLITISLNPGVRPDTNSASTPARRYTTLGQVIQNAIVPVDTKFFAGTPFQTIGAANVTTRINAGDSNYDALQIALDRRFDQGLQFKLAYTLAKARGNTAGGGVPSANFQLLDQLNLDKDEGPTNFDRRHNFVFSGLYQIPKTRGLMVSTIIRALSGTPFTIFDSRVDGDRNGINLDPLPAGSFTGRRRFPNGETLSFDYDNQGGRNGARNPGFFQTDLRLAYKYNLTERINAGFTFELFNLFNRVNYDTVSGNFNGGANADFLVPTILSPSTVPRTMQLGFRVAF
jgi:outer membrane receptor protein involved in Fe transport